MSESNIDLDTFLTPRLRVMRIILLALLLGCLIFLGLVVAMRLANNLRDNSAPLLTYMAAGFAALMLVLHVVVPRFSVASARKQIARGNWPIAAKTSSRYPEAAETMRGMSDAGELCMLYQMQMIVGAAMLEGATFFALIAFLVEGDPASLIVAGILIALLVWRFPTRARVENFLVEQGELLRQERQAA
jgi:hypothetical protein